jgi:hypothetical protein
VAALHRAWLVFDGLDQVCGERLYPAFDELLAAPVAPPSRGACWGAAGLPVNSSGVPAREEEALEPVGKPGRCGDEMSGARCE